MTSPEVKKLGKRIADLEDALESLMRNGTGLGHSSFENGQLNQYTDGAIGATFGTQYDGTNGIVVLNGPPPPTPRWSDQYGPKAEGVVGGLRLRWEGYFEPDDRTVAPQDFKSVEFYVSDQSSPSLLFDNLKTAITSGRGGEVLIPMPVSPDGYYVWMVARSMSGRASGFSEVIGPLFPEKIREEDLGFEIADIGGTTISRGPDEPVSPSYGDLWLKTPGNIAYRFEPPDPGTWNEARDQGVVEAINTAIDAQTSADDAAAAAAAAGLSAADANTLAADAKQRADDAAGAAQAASQAAQAASGLATLAKTTADGKVTVYRQASMPTGGAYGANDLWIGDTGLLFAWSGSWVAVSDQRIATALSTANGKTTVFAQISAPSTTGRTVGDIWIDTDDGNTFYDWSGSWTKRAIGAAAISATARQLGAITTYRQASPPAAGMVVGDFWIDSDDNQIYRYEGATPTWVASRDTAINQAITNAATAQSTADGKMRIFTQISAPTGLVAGDVGDMWIDTDDDNKSYTWELLSGTTYGWVARQISNSSIKPNSLVARDIIATGTVSAALLEAILILATTIVAGDPTKTHVKIKNDGVYVYAEDPLNGIPNEVIRMGTASNDFFGITNGSGMLVTSLDQTGAVNARTANFREDIVVGGMSINEKLSRIPGGGGNGTAVPGARNYFGYNPGAFINGVTTEIGLIEVEVTVETGRIYWCVPTMYWTRSTNGTYLEVRVRDGGANAPTINSPLLMGAFFTGGDNASWTLPAEIHRTVRFDTPGKHRLLLTVTAGGGGSVNIVDTYAQAPQLTLVDLGWDQGNGSSVNRGGGSTTPPPPPTQQYFQELAPAGWQSFNGSGGVRNDVTGPVQGWDPSGYNGDGWGYWWFNLPSITGTVDRIEFYSYSNHWYYNSGGTARMRAIKAGGGVITGISDQGPFPKPGGRTVDLSGWKDLFHNSQGANRAIGIQVGPGGGTNLTYYGRFDGPSARLRVWFTQ